MGGVLISLSVEELVALEAFARAEVMTCPACPYEADGDHPEAACGEHLSLSYARWRLTRMIASLGPGGGATIAVRPDGVDPKAPDFRDVRDFDALPSEYLESGDVAALYRWLCPSLTREQAAALRDSGLHFGHDVGDWRGLQTIIRAWLASGTGS